MKFHLDAFTSLVYILSEFKLLMAMPEMLFSLMIELSSTGGQFNP